MEPQPPPSPTGYHAVPTSPPSSSASASSSSSSSDSDEFSTTSSEYYARQDQLQWEESVRQLSTIVTICVIPYFGKWLGRKASFWAYGRYCQLGFSFDFWVGAWAGGKLRSMSGGRS